jgi:hypothetical protein
LVSKKEKMGIDDKIKKIKKGNNLIKYYESIDGIVSQATTGSKGKASEETLKEIIKLCKQQNEMDFVYRFVICSRFYKDYYIFKQKLQKDDKVLNDIFPGLINLIKNIDAKYLNNLIQKESKINQDFYLICQLLTDISIKIKQEVKALRILYKILYTLIFPNKDNRHIFTSIHCNIAKLALRTKFLNIGEMLIRNRILEVNPNLYPITNTQDLLSYHYYAGMIYSGLRKYRDAINMYTMCIILPTNEISAISVEAYKKITLLNLIVKGKRVQLPSYTSNQLMQHLPATTESYQKFTNAFLRNLSSFNGKESDINNEIYELVNSFEKELETDNNYGLILECLSKLKEQNVLKLTKTYVTLNIDDLDYEPAYLLSIDNLNVKIDMKLNIVVFNDDEDIFETKESANNLKTLINNVNNLNKIVKERNYKIITSKEYKKSANPTAEPYESP